MKELVKVMNNDIFTDSWIVAEGTGNAHRSIVSMIEKYSDKFIKMGELIHHLKWSDNSGKSTIQIYNLNEPQATFLMTLLGNSEVIVNFKFELVRQFYAMRQYILEHQTIHWQQTRLENKENRLKETKEIDAFIQYAKEHGSHHAGWYYKSLSLLADSVAGIKPNDREQATASQLNILTLVEHIITEEIKAGIAQQRYYKEIYKACKAKIEQFQEVACLTKNP